jgi:hypothetical protein
VLKTAWLTWLGISDSKPKIWITAAYFSDPTFNGQFIFSIQDLDNKSNNMGELFSWQQ